MFNDLQMAPPDPILGLTEAFKLDENPDKINLSTGVYKDEQDTTPILQCVRAAEQRLVETEKTKSYLPIPGMPEYGAAVRELLFGAGHEIIGGKRAVTAQTPGGTGALRVAGDFIKNHFPNATIWLSDPTWANHKAIFTAAGVPIKSYPYYDHESKSLDFAAMTAALKDVPAGDVVLLHGCCHNPSGMDPDADQWKELAAIADDRGFLPLFDFAYQGFGQGLDEDAAGLRMFCTPGRELIICSSFSKNFGLYCERVGAVTLVAKDADDAATAFSNLKVRIRSNYSNPPMHGAAVVNTILNDPAFRKQWEEELTGMRDRINGMRHLLADTLKAKGVDQDFSFMTTQCGMFSFSGLTKEQVEKLKEDYGIYIVGSGRINVAGITPGNVDRLCEAIASVL
jgi:aspartate/tyrosine/aromatic aminotransferase